jgi:tetratricopeptide (TPR) repeat protein
MKSTIIARNTSSACAAWMAVLLLAGCQTVSGGSLTSNDKWAASGEGSPQAKAYAHYLASVVYTRNGDQNKALDEMRQVAELDPNALTPTLRLVRSYLRAQDYDKALEMAERAVKQKPDQVNLWVVLGEIYHQLQRFPDANECFQKAITLAPNNILGYGAMVELLEGTNDIVTAVDLYDKLISLSPNAAGMYYQKAVALARMNQNDEARKSLEKAIELNPKLIQAYFLLGSASFEMKDYAAAVRYLSYYSNLRPKNARAWELLAAAYFRQGKFNDAIGAYLKIQEQGQLTPAQSVQGMYLMLVTGNPEVIEKILPDKGAPIFTAAFRTLLQKQTGADYKPALAALDTVEGDIEQECTDFLPGINYLYGDIEAGGWIIDRFQELRAETPSWTLGVIQARILAIQKKWSESIAAYTALLDNTPRDKAILYNLAVCYEEAKQFDEAENYLRKYIEYDSTNPDVLNFLGYLYADQNIKLHEAEKLVRAALAITPESPFYLDSMGWVFYRQGKAAEAVDYIQRAIYLMDNDDAILRNHLGDAWLLKGDKQKAVEQWKRALRLDSTIEGVSEKIEANTPKDSSS